MGQMGCPSRRGPFCPLYHFLCDIDPIQVVPSLGVIEGLSFVIGLLGGLVATLVLRLQDSVKAVQNGPTELGPFRQPIWQHKTYLNIQVRVQVEARQGDGGVRRRRLQGHPARQRRRNAGMQGCQNSKSHCPVSVFTLGKKQFSN